MQTATTCSHDSLQDVLRKFTARIPIRDNKHIYRRMFAWCQLVIVELEKFIKEHETWFISRFAFGNKKCTPVVRIFADKPNKFMMTHELLKAMKQEQMDVSGFEKEVLDMPELSTFTYQEVAKRVSHDDLRMIEFVITPIHSSNYAATLIPTINPGEYCILVSDFLFNLLGNMISAKKLFQKIELSQFDAIQEFFTFINKYFDLASGIQFVNLKVVEVINMELEVLYQMLTFSNKESSDIRDKKKFTKNDLENELKYLKLDSIFPECCELSQMFFEHMADAKKSETLSTTDIHNIVEYLQFDCIARRIPQIAEFIHSQVACTMIYGYYCETCTKEKEENVAGKEQYPHVEVASVAIKEEVVKSVIKIKEDQEKSSTLKMEKPKKTKKQKPSDQQLFKDAVKDSESCQKCFRTSEYHRKTKEDLRLEKIETKHLKKSLKLSQNESDEKSLIIAEKDQEIQLLKEQVETTQQELLDRKSEENKIKDETIRLLTEQLLDHQNALAQKSLEVLEQSDEIRLLKAQIQGQQNVIAQQSVSIKSLEQRSQERKSVPILESKSQRSAEEIKVAQTIVFETLKAREIFETEDPLSKIYLMTSRICENTQNQEVKNIAKREFRYFERQIKCYGKGLNNRIKEMNIEHIKTNQIPELRKFPTFCDEFVSAYKNTLKEDAPIICAELLSTSNTPKSSSSDELEDNECLVCLEDMETEQETMKCLTCKRQYHSACVRKWFKVKRICPTCDAGLLEETEFPALL